MIIQGKTPEEYLANLPEDKRLVMERLRETVRKNLPEGFSETMQYDMITYVVPKEKYPKGYHCNPEDELGFISLGAQKNHIAIYHMGIYMMKDIYDWFVGEYPNHMKTKLNMGKSCIRFTNLKTIPYDLIGDLCRKITLEDYVKVYEENLNNKK